MYSFPIRSGEHDVQVDQPANPILPPHHIVIPPQPLLAAELQASRSNASSSGAAMQLMTFNSLLMFDIVFVFFLFLVGVTCLVYYMPPATSRSSSSASTSTATSISNSSSAHSGISASVSTKSCRHHHGHSYQDLHHHHHQRDHCSSASRMATHREHGFAAAAVLSSVECEMPEVACRSSHPYGLRDDRCRASRSGSATIEFFTATAATATKFANEGRLLVERPATGSQVTEATPIVATTSDSGGSTRTVPQCCYVKEKWQRRSLSSSRKYQQAPVHEV